MLDLKVSSPHVNLLPWMGLVCLLDTPSDKAPKGALGHKLTVTRSCAEAASRSLVGMGICAASPWDTHTPQRKLGIITRSWISGRRLMVRGYLWRKDFAEDIAAIRQHGTAELGLSFELDATRIDDMRAPVYVATRTTFTGVAIIAREKAAYRSSRIWLAKETMLG